MTIINDDFKKDLGKRLQDLREQKGVTIKEVVDLLSRDYYCSINEKSIKRYEQGDSLPKIDNLICIAELYGTTLDYIVYGRETSDDNSFTWYDNFKRLNRLLYTMQIKMLIDEKNVYLQLLDDEARQWFATIECLKSTRKVTGEIIDIKDLDNLFRDFKEDSTQLLPIQKRVINSILAAKPIITGRVEENDKITTITYEIQRH